jgi:zinc and cadmium transporter
MALLAWIVAAGLGMALISLVGVATLLLHEPLLNRLLLPLVALAAGSLIGGAFFHLIPTALEEIDSETHVWLLVTAGFVAFFALEQALHWHRRHGDGGDREQPLTYLVLIGDAIHNFIDGITVCAAFLVDVRLGVTAWVAAAAHEIPQELGDFAVLLHGGWSKLRATAFNLLSSLTFLAGGVLTYAASAAVDVSYLVPFAAGTFLYIGATDLVPEINKRDSARSNVLSFAIFLAGVALMYGAALLE